MRDKGKTEQVRVWDPLVRIGHWLLVGGFFVAYFTEDELLTVHVWAGYLVGAIVIVRILWGFVGPSHARFRDFLYSPARSVAYLIQLARHRAHRYLGHSPAGGAMVLLLLASLVATTWSGLMVYAYEEKAGPLAPMIVADVVDSEASPFGDEDSDSAFEEREDFWEELHEFAANFTLFLVFLHVGGVFLASRAHRENLVGAMITGRKRSWGNSNSNPDAPLS